MLGFRAAMMLVTLAVGTFAASARTAAAPRPQASDKKEITELRLTTDRLNKYETAVKSYQKLTKENPKLKAQLDKEAQAQEENSIANSVRTIEKHPELVATIKEAGLSTPDYVVMTYTIINGFAAVKMKRKGSIKQIPTSISPENAAFIDQNYDRIEGIVNLMMPPDEDKDNS